MAIQQCVSGQCLPKTKFEWQVGKVQFIGYSNLNHESPKPIVNSDSSDNGVRLLDVNKNGYADFVYSKANDRRTYLNTGSGWQENNNYQLKEPIVDNDGVDKGVRFLDINGDDLIDYVRGDDANNYKKVYVNNGSAWELSSSFILLHPIVSDYNYTYTYQYQDCGWYKWSHSCSWHTSSAKSKIAYSIPSGLVFTELNGDGLIDIVYGKNGTREVYLNNGSNWIKSNTFVLPFDIMKTSSEVNLPYVRNNIEVLDINGDGLSDIVSAVDGNRHAYINTGSNWQKDESYALPEAIKDNKNYHYAMRLQDLNGDGLPNLIYSSTDISKTYLNSGNSWLEKTAYILQRVLCWMTIVVEILVLALQILIVMDWLILQWILVLLPICFLLMQAGIFGLDLKLIAFQILTIYQNTFKTV